MAVAWRSEEVEALDGRCPSTSALCAYAQGGTGGGPAGVGHQSGLHNVFKYGELGRAAAVAKNAKNAADGKSYQVEYFNPGAILSVGYRVKSKQGTRFRQSASRRMPAS